MNTIAITITLASRLAFAAPAESFDFDAAQTGSGNSKRVVADDDSVTLFEFFSYGGR